MQRSLTTRRRGRSRKALTGQSASWLALLAIAITASAQTPEAERPATRWTSAMEEFARLDAESPAQPGGILFLGSSSIRMWDLAEWFPELPTLNRGFGGSYISDSIHFIERLVFPHAPRVLVFYAGDNDIAAGKTPERVAADFAHFASTVRERLPECRIVFVAIKPSLARWELVESMREANRLIAEQADRDPRVVFLDIDAPMLGDDGRPRPELFADDGLHLNRAGYELWSGLLRPLLASASPSQ